MPDTVEPPSVTTPPASSDTWPTWFAATGVATEPPPKPLPRPLPALVPEPSSAPPWLPLAPVEMEPVLLLPLPEFRLPEPAQALRERMTATILRANFCNCRAISSGEFPRK